VVDVLAGLPFWVVPLVAVVVVAAEPAVLPGIVLPSVASVVLLGFVSGLDVLPLWAAVALVAVAAAAGDAAAFRAGRRHLTTTRAPGCGAGTRMGRAIGRGWEQAERLYTRVGRPMVALARWVTVARTLVPRLAGMSGLSWARFLALAVPSALLWAASLTAAGYLVGASYAEVSRYVGRGGGALLTLALSLAGVVALGHWMGRHPDPVRRTAERVGASRAMRRLERHLAGDPSQRLIERTAALATLAVGLLVLALLLHGTVGVALSISGLRRADDWLLGQFAALQQDGATAAAWLVVGTLRSTWVLATLAVLTAAVSWARHTRRCSPDLSDRMIALASTLLPLLALALAGVLVGFLAPEPREAAVEDWVLGAQLPVVTAATALLAGLLTAGRPWPVRAAAATLALAVAVALASARVYLGWETPSWALTSVLVGLGWAVLLLTAWRQLTRAVDRSAPPLAVQLAG
jgi:undecaprenyl-diphosphatase